MDVPPLSSGRVHGTYQTRKSHHRSVSLDGAHAHDLEDRHGSCLAAYGMVSKKELLIRFEQDVTDALAASKQTRILASFSPGQSNEVQLSFSPEIALLTFAIKGPTRLFIIARDSGPTFER